MALWRCMNDECPQPRNEFEAAGNNCPVCKLYQGMELEPVHYFVPAEGPIRTGVGNRMIACDPNNPKMPKGASGIRSCVSCKKCRATAIFVEDERDNINNSVPWIEQKFASGELSIGG